MKSIRYNQDPSVVKANRKMPSKFVVTTVAALAVAGCSPNTSNQSEKISRDFGTTPKTTPRVHEAKVYESPNKAAPGVAYGFASRIVELYRNKNAKRLVDTEVKDEKKYDLSISLPVDPRKKQTESSNYQLMIVKLSKPAKYDVALGELNPDTIKEVRLITDPGSSSNNYDVSMCKNNQRGGWDIEGDYAKETATTYAENSFYYNTAISQQAGAQQPINGETFNGIVSDMDKIISQAEAGTPIDYLNSTLDVIGRDDGELVTACSPQKGGPGGSEK